jgi:hypothetical protein
VDSRVLVAFHVCTGLSWAASCPRLGVWDLEYSLGVSNDADGGLTGDSPRAKSSWSLDTTFRENDDDDNEEQKDEEKEMVYLTARASPPSTTRCAVTLAGVERDPVLITGAWSHQQSRLAS